MASAPARLAARRAARNRRIRKAGGVVAVGSKAQVYKGLAKHTTGGLTRSGIMRIKVGVKKGTTKSVYRYVSKKKHMRGKSLARVQPALRLWRAAMARAGIPKGKFPKKGTTAYRRVRAIYVQMRLRGGVRSTPSLRRIRLQLAARTARAGRKARKGSRHSV